MKKGDENRVDILKTAVYALVFIIIFFFALIMARQILIPLALGFLFATLIYPLTRLLITRVRFPERLANLVAVLAFVAVLFLAINLLVNQIQVLAQDFPTLKQKALANMEYLRLFLEENFDIDPDSQVLWLRDRVRGVFESGSTLISDTINATAGTVFQLVLVPVFMYYMLSFREQFRDFIIRITPRVKREQAQDVMAQISTVVQRYISGVFTVVFILCFLNSIGLYIVGLRYAIIFGIISALFNIIPYFGTWIGASFPIIFALLTGDTPGLAVSVFIMYLIIQFTENNILTPNITGGYVRLNPLITILSIIVGGMVWGIAGMLVVIPFMATLKILFENVDELRPYAFLLSNEHGMRRVIRFRKFFRRQGDKLKTFDKHREEH
jgi:predicted PurR-regulated permease PerM